MKELDLALVVLNDDLDNDVMFGEALRKVFVADEAVRPYRPNVSGLVGCVLRHYLLFTFLLNPLADFTVEEKRIVMLGMANNHFFRHIEAADMDAAVKEKIGEEKFAAVENLLKGDTDLDALIPDTIARPSNRYLSLRFNVPEWALKIFQREGNGAAYRTIRTFGKPLVTTVRATSRLSEEAFAAADLQPTSITGIYNYQGKIALRRHDPFRRNEFFCERPYVKKIYDEMKVSECQNVLLYTSQADPEWEMEMLESMSVHSNVNIAVDSLDAKASFARHLKARDVHNVNYFEAKNPDEMVAAISQECEVVIAAPNCSMFDRIPTSPDFLLHYNREVMEPIYEKQPLVLAGVAKHVAQGGRLVYVVPTISRREGHRVVDEFLRAHSEFSLDKEEQMLPYQNLGCSCYYAVLYKGEKAKVTDNPPMVEVMPKPEAPIAAAKAE